MNILSKEITRSALNSNLYETIIKYFVELTSDLEGFKYSTKIFLTVSVPGNIRIGVHCGEQVSLRCDGR